MCSFCRDLYLLCIECLGSFSYWDNSVCTFSRHQGHLFVREYTVPSPYETVTAACLWTSRDALIPALYIIRCSMHACSGVSVSVCLYVAITLKSFPTTLGYSLIDILRSATGWTIYIYMYIVQGFVSSKRSLTSKNVLCVQKLRAHMDGIQAYTGDFLLRIACHKGTYSLKMLLF